MDEPFVCIFQTISYLLTVHKIRRGGGMCPVVKNVLPVDEKGWFWIHVLLYIYAVTKNKREFTEGRDPTDGELDL